MVNTRRVGFFIPNGNTYCRNVLEGINAFCQVRNRWKLVLTEGAEKEVFLHLANHLDGLIVGVEDEQFAAILQAWGKPCVDVLNRAPNYKFPRVSIDIRAIGRIGAEHLIGLGFQRFAFCGFERYPFSLLRERGFEETIRQAGGSCLVHRIDASVQDWPSVWKDVAAWVAGLPKPIGLMAAKQRGRNNFPI